MELVTKATINIKEGIIILEGSEDFVKRYLDEFKTTIFNLKPAEEIKNDTTFIKTDAKRNTSNKSIVNKVSSKSKSKVKDVKPEKIDIFPKDKDSLESFIKLKKPNDSSAKEKIVVVAYFIKNTLGLDSFSDENIEYVYRTLKIKGKPLHLRQMLIDMKNKDGWLDNNDSGGWTINRVGEKFVDEKLPREKKIA
jgi:hypothetical protein